MKSRTVETIVGLIVIIFTVGAFYYGFNKEHQGFKGAQYYDVKAFFKQIDGIHMDSDIRVAGVKVGFVNDIQLDQESYQAILTLRINKGFAVPVDSQALIKSEGLLGGKFVSLSPGEDDTSLKEGEFIKRTYPSIGFEDILNKVLINIGK